MQITISDALAALRMTSKKVAAKRTSVRDAGARPAPMIDPHEDSGGSKKWVKVQLQAIADLGDRHIALRGAILRSNAETKLEIGRRTRTVSDWLVWRREVVETQKAVLEELQSIVTQVRRSGGQFRDPSGANPVAAVVNVDEEQVMKGLENITDTLGVLDGRLSAMNATTRIEVPDEVS